MTQSNEHSDAMREAFDAYSKANFEPYESVYLHWKTWQAAIAHERIRMEAGVRRILNGIDKDEYYNKEGWWETPESAEFGKGKLDELLHFLNTKPHGGCDE